MFVGNPCSVPSLEDKYCGWGDTNSFQSNLILCPKSCAGRIWEEKRFLEVEHFRIASLKPREVVVVVCVVDWHLYNCKFHFAIRVYFAFIGK